MADVQHQLPPSVNELLSNVSIPASVTPLHLMKYLLSQTNSFNIMVLCHWSIFQVSLPLINAEAVQQAFSTLFGIVQKQQVRPP